MMPGIIPSLLMAGSSIYGAFVDPPVGNWFGVELNYYTSAYAMHSGGQAPFTYAWFSDIGDLTIVNPASRSVNLTSRSGRGGALGCTITDATGQSETVYGVLTAIDGGIG